MFCRLNISHKMLLVSTTATNEAIQSIKSEQDQTFSLIHSNNKIKLQFFYEPLYASLKNQHHAIHSSTKLGKDTNWIFTF